MYFSRHYINSKQMDQVDEEETDSFSMFVMADTDSNEEKSNTLEIVWKLMTNKVVI